MQLLLVSMLLAVCAGFNQAPQVPRSAVSLRRAALVMDEAATEAPAEEATEEAAAEAAAPAVEYSESLPFLVKRPQLKGYIGDVGFDPLGFSEILPMVRSCSGSPLTPSSLRSLSRKPPLPLASRAAAAGTQMSLATTMQDWLREAELKHCRVSMLAFVRRARSRPAEPCSETWLPGHAGER